MTTEKLVMCVDVDMVVANLMQGIRNALGDPTIPDATEWDGLLKGTRWDVDWFWAQVYDGDDFYQYVPKFEWSDEVASLADCFVTSSKRHFNAMHSKNKWLHRHFPTVPIIHMDNKRLLDSRKTVLVDDRPYAHNNQIWFPAPHNGEGPATPLKVREVIRQMRAYKQLTQCH